MNIVEATHVSKEYYLGKQKVTALTDVSITITKGEFLAIAGSSG
ncbi:MAG: putative ABC transport system ATP-binding protein, partial [Gammaproteobacteria bacterium]